MPAPLPLAGGRRGERRLPAASVRCRSTTTSCPARCWRAPWGGRTASGPPWRCGGRRWSGSAASPPWSDHLADDNVLGRLVQGLGLAVALADTVPATTVPETTLRAPCGATNCAGRARSAPWCRCQFAASVLQYPLVWAALAVAAGLGRTLVAGLVRASPGLIRAVAARGIDRRARHLPIRTPLWLLPLRELMSVAVMIASYAGRRVDWRGHTHAKRRGSTRDDEDAVPASARRSTGSTAAPARAIRRGGRSAASGIRPGWRSRPRWCPAAS